MNREERLFQAIGAADPALVERSGRKREPSHWGRWIWSAAACLAVLAVSGSVFLGTFRCGSADPAAGMGDASSAAPAAPAAPKPPAAPAAAGEPSESGMDGAGTSGASSGSARPGEACHLIQLGASAGSPSFLIYLDPAYTMAESGGLWRVVPAEPLPEYLPACEMTILHRPGVDPETAAREAAEALRASYGEVSETGEYADGLHIRAGDGVEWDDRQAEVWAVDDRQGGSYLLTGVYFLEAEEGHGLRFRNMAATFQPVTDAIPDWLVALRTTADAVCQAALAGETESVPHLLAEGADVDCPVMEGVSISSVDCAVDDPGDPKTAVVSARVSPLEDSCDYLTLELERRDGQWLVTFGGLEK